MLQVIPRTNVRTPLKLIFNGLKLSIEEEEMLQIKSNNSRRILFCSMSYALVPSLIFAHGLFFFPENS